MIARAMARTWGAAWQEVRANRRAFWTQLIAMAVNDIVWVGFWTLFFRRVDTLRGWDLDRVILLFAILATTAGLVVGLLANARSIGTLAITGALDAALALPTPTLLHLLLRKIDTTNLGDLVFGLTLFAIRGHPTPARTVTFVFVVLSASVLAAGFLVMAGSLSFFVGRNEAGELGFQSLFLFANYPIDVFGGFMKTFLFVVVPAGFVTGVPARLIDDFSLPWAAALVGAAIAFALGGWTMFNLGLRRYTSGAVWTNA